MARRLSEPQAAALSAFVQALYGIGGFASWADFAREAGYHPTSMSDLKNGKSGIDGPNLLALIEAAARRSGQETADVAVKAATGRETDAPEPVHLGPLEEVAAVRRGVEALLAHFGVDVPRAVVAEPERREDMQ